MNKVLATILVIVAIIPFGTAYADEDIAVLYDGKKIAFNEKSIVLNQRTLVQLRPIAEALDLGIEYEIGTGSVLLSNADAVVTFSQNSDIVNINGEDTKMDVPMIIHNDYSFVPVRNLVEPFGNQIVYDGETNTVMITPKTEKSEPEEIIPKETENTPLSIGSGLYDSVFFYQSQPEFEFENNGRGYCWVCSYAMLMSDKDNLITPKDIAEFNTQNGYSGSFMAGHETLVRSFGRQLVPALSEDSEYFGGFNLNNRGETSLKITSFEDAKAAICEALDNFPNGVMVRFECYPHTMLAVDYDDENIYFNDPAKQNGEHIPFEETCLKNYKLEDISFIQAVK